MKRLLAILALIFALVSTSLGANHYVLPSPGTGSHNGSDWSNACSDFTGSCVATANIRGDVYYVGGGSYASRTFHTPVSGTLTITIKGATASDHGTATGWSNSLGVDVTQASFGNPVQAWDGYTILDGNTGTPAAGPSSYGFTVALPGSCAGGNTPIAIGPGGSTVNNVQISHFYLKACPGDVETDAIFLQTTTTASNHIYSFNYIDGFETAFFDHSTGVTIDHNYLINAFSSPSHHGNEFDFIDAEVNPIISFNVVLNCAGTVCLGANDIGSTCSAGLVGAQIYGNIFNAALPAGGTQPVGDGIIGATSRCFIKNTVVYSNTFTGSNSGWDQACVTGQATCASATGNVAKNNLIWSETCALGSGITTHDYNTYLSCTDTAPTEANGQIASFDPFVNSAANDFRLATDTALWFPLAGPYRLDQFGVTRTTSRGANQITIAPLFPQVRKPIVM